MSSLKITKNWNERLGLIIYLEHFYLDIMLGKLIENDLEIKCLSLTENMTKNECIKNSVCCLGLLRYYW